MARAVLIAALLAAGTAAADMPPACPGAGPDAEAIVADALASPLALLAADRFGAPRACRLNPGATVAAQLAYPGGATLTVEAIPAIGVAAQALTLAPDTPPLPPETVAPLAAAQGEWALGEGGCGFTDAAVAQALATGTPETAVEGMTCNCRLTLSRDAQGLRAIRFGTAC